MEMTHNLHHHNNDNENVSREMRVLFSILKKRSCQEMTDVRASVDRLARLDEYLDLDFNWIDSFD
jgi:hypothetical protein